jgi:hypothetical protein
MLPQASFLQGLLLRLGWFLLCPYEPAMQGLLQKDDGYPKVYCHLTG